MTIASMSHAAQIILLNLIIQVGCFPVVGGTNDKMVGFLKCESLPVLSTEYGICCL